MKIGYARVSTPEQSLNLQIDALKQAGCDDVFTDTVSGAKAERPGLRDVFRFLREGDTLIVWKLDRLGRSVKNLIENLQEINKRKACFISLQDNINTATTMGNFIFHITAAFAELERELTRERTRAGLKAAIARGRCGGRKKMLDENKVARMVQLRRDGNSIPEICKIFDISRPTFYKYFNAE